MLLLALAKAKLSTCLTHTSLNASIHYTIYQHCDLEDKFMSSILAKYVEDKRARQEVWTNVAWDVG